MCYSKEVQLITGSIIVLSSIFYYLTYSLKFKQTNKAWLKPFLTNVILIFLCIGLHQLFEFLSLTINNQIIYKVGLIISISSMYFMLRSLEVLANKKIYSQASLILIMLVALHAFLSSMSFEGTSFFVRHHSVFIWATAWMLLFIYWHICALNARKDLKDDDSRKIMLLYLLAVADLSFILSAAYVIIGYFSFGVNVCQDSPSIWCTFFVIQAFFAPVFLSVLPKVFLRPNKEKEQKISKTIFYILLSILILAILILSLPFFHCLTWKFIFP